MRHSRTSEYLAALLAGYGASTISLFSAFLVSPILLTWLGRDRIGRWLAVAQVVGLLGLVDLGVATSFSRQFGLLKIVDSAGRRDLLGHALSVSVLQMPFICLAGVIASVILTSSLGGTESGQLLLIVVSTFVLTFPTRILREALRAQLDLRFLAGVQISIGLAVLGVQVSMAYAGLGEVSLAVGWMAGECLSAFAVVLRARGLLLDCFPLRTLWGIKGPLDFGSAGWVAGSQLSQFLIVGSDLLLVGWFYGAQDVTTYSFTTRLLTTFSQFPTLVLLVASPTLVQLYAECGTTLMTDRLHTLTSVALAASLLLATTCVGLDRSFVEAWVGSENYGGLALITLAAVTSSVRVLRLGPAIGLFVLGRQSVVTLTTLASSIVSLCVAVFATRQSQLTGIAFGFFFGALCVELPVLFLAYVRATGQTISTVAQRLLLPVPGGAVALAGAAAVSFWNPPLPGFAGVALVGLVVAIIALLGIAPLAFASEVRSEIRERLSRRVGRGR